MRERKPRLDGKVALVLGASRENNMGQAIARAFTDEGAAVVMDTRASGLIPLLPA